MGTRDVNFTFDDGRFNYRVAGLVVNGDRILLQTNPEVDFHNMIGGRVKLLESTSEALIRECQEELGFTPTDFSLIRVAESFFEWEGTPVQEVVFVYLIRVDDDNELAKKQDFSNLDKPKEVCHWFGAHELKDINIRPIFIYEYENLDFSFKHSTEDKKTHKYITGK